MAVNYQARRDGSVSSACSRAGMIALCLLLSPQTASAQDVARAATTFPHAPVRWSDRSGEIEFHVAGDVAVLTLRLPDGNVTVLRQIGDPNDALAVLGDERLRFTWPALLSWAGADLGLLRDRSLLHARTGFEAGLPGAVAKGQVENLSGTWQVAAKLQYARMLRQTGHRIEAAEMLRREIANLPHTVQTTYPRVLLTLRLAGMVYDTDPASGIELLEPLIADPATSLDQKVNVEVNLAQYLVRSGDFARALPLIDKVWTTYSQSNPQDQEAEKQPGSEAQFAWIKACALRGLGKKDEADQMMSSISPTSEFPIASQARLSGFMCMKDTNALAKEFVTQLKSVHPASYLFVRLQPESYGYAPDRDLVTAALRVPELAQAVATQVHFLSGALTPALREWRNGESAQ